MFHIFAPIEEFFVGKANQHASGVEFPTQYAHDLAGTSFGLHLVFCEDISPQYWFFVGLVRSDQKVQNEGNNGGRAWDNVVHVGKQLYHIV